MKTYEKYKPSGVEWIGEIPEHWEIKPLTKYLQSIADYRGRTPTKVDSGIFLVTARNIKNGKIDYTLSQEYVEVSDAQSLLNRGIPKIGDVLLTTEAPLGEVANIDREDIALAQRIIKLSGKNKILDNYFLKYWLVSDNFQQDLHTYATGSTAIGIKASKLSNLLLAQPPINEQTQIANFLDRKTAKIDDLITKKEQLIKLLEEEKTAVINEAVTKGINPNVKLKDSGIEWLGNTSASLSAGIPEHWEVKRLKYVAQANPSNIDKKSKEDEEEVKLCNYVDVYKNDFIDNKIDFMVATASESQIAKFTLEKGDVIATKDSETPDDIGNAALVVDELTNVVCGYHLTHIKPTKINGDFLFRFFQSRYLNSYFEVSANGVTRFGLGFDKFNSAQILLPQQAEQIAIVNHIQKETTRIDKTIETTKKLIELLKEYRTALISEAVTGKIKVFEDDEL